MEYCKRESACYQLEHVQMHRGWGSDVDDDGCTHTHSARACLS